MIQLERHLSRSGNCGQNPVITTRPKSVITDNLVTFITASPITVITIPVTVLMALFVFVVAASPVTVITCSMTVIIVLPVTEITCPMTVIMVLTMIVITASPVTDARPRLAAWLGSLDHGANCWLCTGAVPHTCQEAACSGGHCT